MKNLKTLSREIVSKSHMVAIVGNAGIDEDEQDLIESCDTVMRFNNYGSREGITYTRDKKKCDILMTTFDGHTTGAEPDHTIIGVPFPFNAESIKRKQAKWYPKSQMWALNPYTHLDMLEQLDVKSNGYIHPFPSLGATALWHMHTWNVQFVVCGFTWYFNTKTKMLQGRNPRDKNYPTNWNHNYHKESFWVIDNLVKRNNFIFSPKCYNILSQIKALR